MYYRYIYSTIHKYRVPAAENVKRVESELTKLMADRGYQHVGAATSLITGGAYAVDISCGNCIMHMGGSRR